MNGIKPASANATTRRIAPGFALVAVLALLAACQAEPPPQLIPRPQPQPGDDLPLVSAVMPPDASVDALAAPVADAAPTPILPSPVAGQQVVLASYLPRVRATRSGPFLNVTPSGHLTTEPITIAEIVDDDVRVVFDAGDVRFWLWVEAEAILPVVLDPVEISLDPSPASWSRTGIWITDSLTAVRVEQLSSTPGWARIVVPPIERRRGGGFRISGFVPSELVTQSFPPERVEAATVGGPASRPTKRTPTAWVTTRTEIVDEVGGRVLATIDANAYRRLPILEVKDAHVLTEVRGDGAVVIGWLAKEALSETPSPGSGYGESGRYRPQRVGARVCVFDSTGQPVGVVVRPTKLPVWKDGRVEFGIPWGWERFALKRTTDGWETCPDEAPWNDAVPGPH